MITFFLEGGGGYFFGGGELLPLKYLRQDPARTFVYNLFMKARLHGREIWVRTRQKNGPDLKIL